MLKIYKKSGKVHQEIPIDESIKKYSDLIPLVNQANPRENLFYGENEIKYKCKTMLVDSDSQILEDEEEIDFEDDIYVCFKIDYELLLTSRFDSNISFPSFVTKINLGFNEQELPSKWPKSVHTIDLDDNNAKLPSEWPESVHTINLGFNQQELPLEWPESVHTIHLGCNKEKLPSEWPESVHTIHLVYNKQELPSEWPESVHTIHLWDNKAKLPDEWPESVRVISIFSFSPYLENLLSDIRLEKVRKDQYNTYFKLKTQ